MDKRVCDKCGRPVPHGNNAAVLDYLVGNFTALSSLPRHLLPVIENGKVICEGNPSRAQYLPGQPRDKRYPYNPKREVAYREAYTEIQREAFALNALLN